MLIVIIALSSIIIVLLTRLFFINKAVKSMTKQLDNYNSFKTRKKLDVSLVNKNVENLAESINKHMEISKELQLKQSNSEEELKSMISSISHDLRTPLTSIQGYLQMLRKDNLSEEKRKRYIEISDKRSKDLKELLNQFFMLSVVEDPKYKGKLETIDLKESLVEILTSFYEEFTDKGIEPNIEICSEAVNILGDYIGVKRVLENLMINIARHSKGQVKITLLKKNGEAELIIEDALKAEAEIEVDNLFDKFYKADKARKVNSTGLGLSIVKELMGKMNGNVEADIVHNSLCITCRWELSY
ncbi:MAG: HAMP domain-containing sensor histidine kinase [Clostridium sp.]|nr:HAMP domain-containing sensor histidine kinase [Clostridium sp.]MDU7084008.1 HAMP domain-containing sensor histidine kinase [Clostridium sp.]